VLGGSGFIGTNLVAALRAAGHRASVAGHAADSDGTLCLPLADADAIDCLIGAENVDTVVHLVSSLIPGSTEQDFLAERIAVADPTARLAGRLAARGVRLVFVSSGGTVYGVPRRAAAAEDDPCAPISFYGQSKLEIESYLQFLARAKGLRCLIVRPSNPFGPGQRPSGVQGLIAVLLDRIRSGRPLQVWGDGSSVRDYIYIDDLAAPLSRLIEGGVSGMTVNIGSGVGHSLLDVVAAVEHATGRPVPLEFGHARAVDVPRLVLDVSRLKAMGLHQARTLDQGIAAYLAALGDQA
jgi:UDP-glucose 4-epimerase